MKLSPHAEELKRLAEQATTTAAQCKLGRYAADNLNHILRAAEIAEAARKLVRARGAGTYIIAQEELEVLIAKDPT